MVRNRKNTYELDEVSEGHRTKRMDNQQGRKKSRMVPLGVRMFERQVTEK